MNKKIISLIAAISLLMFLNGCFGSDTVSPTPEIKTQTTLYENNEFSIYYPSEWEKIEKTDFTSEMPKETQAAFRNNVKSEIFTANVNISKTDIAERLTSKEYANEIIESQKQSLKNFKEITKEDISLKIAATDVSTVLYVFEGKQRVSDETAKFTQTYLVKGNTGYIATCAVSLEEDENTAKVCQNMIRSFGLK
jgi:hypothetical protein